MMKNRHNRLTRYPLLSVLILLSALLFLSGCDELAMFMEHLDDDVKLANDRYLEVESVYPVQNAAFINPGQDIKITFDRSIRKTDLLDHLMVVDTQNNMFVFDPDDVEFDERTYTATLKPNPYLEDSRQYVFQLDTGLVGAGGSPLRDEYSWSFSTGTYPKGSFTIRDDVALTGTVPKYTTSTTIPLQIVKSAITQFFVDDEEPVALTALDKDNLNWIDQGFIVDISSITGETSNGYALDLSGRPDGPVTVYMMFRDLTNYSPIEEDSTFLDTRDPEPEAGSDVGPVRTGFSRSGGASDPGFTEKTGSGIDATSYRWTSSPAGLTLSGSDKPTVTISGPAGTDDVYTVTLSVKDLAGRNGSDSFLLDWDTIAPNRPSVSGTSPTTGNPAWSWSSGGPSDATGSYRRRLNSGTWYTTSSTSYTSKGLLDGRHRLDVAQYDDAGNLSSYDTHYIVRNAAGIAPYNTQTGVNRTTAFDWPNQLGALSYGLILYTEYRGGWVEAGRQTGLPGSSYTMPGPLDGSTSYGWRYTWSGKIGTNQSSLYVFTTGK